MMRYFRFYNLVLWLLAIAACGGSAAAKDFDVLILSPEIDRDGGRRLRTGFDLAKTTAYLDAMLEMTPSFEGSSCVSHTDVDVDSLLELHYDTRYRADTASLIASGDYDIVIMVPYYPYLRWASELCFEGVMQLSSEILAAGARPIFLMSVGDGNGDAAAVGQNAYRVVNGCGVEVNPAGYALLDSGLFVKSLGSEQAYVIAASLYTQITGLNAADLDYSPVADSAVLAETAFDNLQTQASTTQYNGSRHDSGMVRYRYKDVSASPMNDTVRYAYVGTSTEAGINTHLQAIIQANGWTAASKLVSTSGGGTKYWTDTDFELAKPYLDDYEDQVLFTYARGTTSNGPQIAQYNQVNLLPIVFDRHRDNIGSGAGSSLELLEDIEIGSWYDYYYQRSFSWSAVPFHIGASRFYHSDNSVIVSADGVHVTTPFYNLTASMMLTSALGQDIQPSTTIQNDAQSLAAFNIGKEVVKQLAYLSEDSRYVPDSQLEIKEERMPVATTSYLYSHTFTATGGTAPYTWESISDVGLASGLSLSTEGALTGIPSEVGAFVLVLKVTDANGAIRKRAFRLLVQDHTAPSYTDWADFMFDNSGVGAVGPEEDSDLDGTENFLEFAFGSSPLLGGSPPLKILSHGELRFSRGQSGLQYQVELTENLSDWSTASVVWDSEINVVDLAAVGEEQSVLLDTLDADVGFYRVVVRQLP